ncbi:MAG: glycoside hydrolase family 88 protein, partial [Bacteroidota bacterium]|nr:glycoside hydrolase family 88 protein [Bacteroidota bacterium]
MRQKTIFILMAFLIGSGSLRAQQLPAKKEVMDKMVLTNAYFMDKWADTGKSIITNRERPSNIWTRAVYYEGLMALYG